MKSVEWVRAYYLDPVAHDNWPYSKHKKGYPQIPPYISGGYGHTLACELAHGPRPSGLYAIHTCRNRHCFWAEHLMWGTPKRNQEDRLRDGTHNRGERHGLHKLTEAQVLEIRARADEPRVRIAAEFGVSEANVRHIIRRVTWAWLERT